MHADESACVIQLRIIPKNKRKHRRFNGRTKSRHVIIVKDRLIRVLSIDEVLSKLAFSNGNGSECLDRTCDQYLPKIRSRKTTMMTMANSLG